MLSVGGRTGWLEVMVVYARVFGMVVGVLGSSGHHKRTPMPALDSYPVVHGPVTFFPDLPKESC